MKNFKTTMINRQVEVSFDHPIFVSARFDAQSISFACQGQWKKESVSIKKENYTIENLQAEVEKRFNVQFY
tara:strand:+ start:367 stop:579 length:213 start_codon:yes stop_codon:yes gene_type:complete